MSHKSKLCLSAVVLMVAIIFAGACSGTNMDDPRQVVIALFGAMEKNDQPGVAHLLDLAEIMKDQGKHYALSGAKDYLFTSPQEILDDLTNDGQTKTRWFSMQRIINKSEIMGTSATVEVTFVDKSTSKAYLTKFGLHRVSEVWKIYSFQTTTEAPE